MRADASVARRRIRAVASHVAGTARRARDGAPTTTMRISDEVRDALARGDAVVALESTIVAHGMPYPANIECALDVEGVIRANGATPATIAIIDGACVIGASREELEKIARMGAACAKCSRRDVDGCDSASRDRGDDGERDDVAREISRD